MTLPTTGDHFLDLVLVSVGTLGVLTILAFAWGIYSFFHPMSRVIVVAKAVLFVAALALVLGLIWITMILSRGAP